MRAFDTRLPILRPPARVACVAAAALVSAGLNLGVLGLYDQASPALWWTPTPEVRPAETECDALRDRGARDACAKQLVARGRAATERAQHVAVR